MNLISDFTGADENPLSEGGNWANLDSSGTALQRVSNAYALSSGGISRSYWTPTNFGPDLQAYTTIVSGTALRIQARVQGEGGAATWDGYEFTAAGSNTIISRVTNASFTTLFTSSVIVTWAAGDKLGARLEGTSLQIWRFPSGGSDWALVTAVGDSTYLSAGKLALGASVASTGDDFFAGNINLTQYAFLSA